MVRVLHAHVPSPLARRRAKGEAVATDVEECAANAGAAEDADGAIQPIAHTDPAQIELRRLHRQRHPLSLDHDPGGTHGLARVRNFRRARLAGPHRVESPGAHERLHRRIECPDGRTLEAKPCLEDRHEIGTDPGGGGAGPAVHLAEVARVVKQGERGFHPPKLRERTLRGLEARRLIHRKELKPDQLPHRP